MPASWLITTWASTATRPTVRTDESVTRRIRRRGGSTPVAVGHQHLTIGGDTGVAEVREGG
jgi:hypothetical protein